MNESKSRRHFDTAESNKCRSSTGLSLAQTSFNRQVSQIIAEWKEEGIKGIRTARNEDIKTLLLADDR